MIIGGPKVYAEAMPRWDRLYLTVVDGEFKGNSYFPIHELLRQSWRPLCAPTIHPPDESNRHQHSFHILERVRDAEDLSYQPEKQKLTQGGADSVQTSRER